MISFCERRLEKELQTHYNRIRTEWLSRDLWQRYARTKRKDGYESARHESKNNNYMWVIIKSTILQKPRFTRRSCSVIKSCEALLKYDQFVGIFGKK